MLEFRKTNTRSSTETRQVLHRVGAFVTRGIKPESNLLNRNLSGPPFGPIQLSMRANEKAMRPGLQFAENSGFPGSALV